MPVHSNDHIIVCLNGPVVLGGLPVPEPELPVGIPTGHKLPVRREAHCAGEAPVHMPHELLPSVQPEPAPGLEHYQSIIQTLPHKVPIVRVQGRIRHRVQIRLTYMFGHHRYPELPQKYLLVVRCRNKLLVIVKEAHTVDGPQMFLVGPLLFPSTGVVLHYLFIGSSHDKGSAFLGVRVKSDAIRNSPAGVGAEHLAGFGVPVPDEPIVGAGDETGAVLAPAEVTHGVGVAEVGLYAFPAAHCVPDLHAVV